MSRPTPSNSDNILDSRDIIARVDELESDLQSIYEEDTSDTRPSFEEWIKAHAEKSLKDDDTNGDASEYLAIKSFADECESIAAEWHHGETLINDSYFVDYAQELADDIGAINKDQSWPNDCIDWERAADELKQDYSSADWDGETFWMRS